MKTSEKTDAIFPALFKASLAMDAAKKDATNPHFKSKYAKIESVLQACEKPLNDAGIMILQPVGRDQTGHFVETTLVHAASGQFISAQMYLSESASIDMQKLAGAVTYARRYSLISLLALPTEDDDGNTASGRETAETVRNRITAFLPKLKPEQAKQVAIHVEKIGGDVEDLLRTEQRVIALAKETK